MTFPKEKKPFIKLSSNLITEVTGKSKHDQITEIEIIFSVFHEIDCLEGCPNLRSFTAISTSLQRISNLSSVSYSLERLCLCEQGITKMENLYLPNLRHLLLHQNSITRIEGLEGCPKLQKLWLFSNKITKIEELHHCSDIRELWLQDNRISRIANLEQLTNLQSFSLANNQIADFKDLQNLTSLVNLKEFSLEDPHFGTNPIALAKGYKNFVLRNLQQIKRLDGIEIHSQERIQAQDAYIEHNLRFNDRIEAIRNENQRQLKMMEDQKRSNESHVEALKQELVKGFRDLESIVCQGRKKMQEESHRLSTIRSKNGMQLQERLQELKVTFTEQVERQIQEETQNMNDEDELYRILEWRIMAIQEQAQFLSSLQSSKEMSFKYLMEQSPDWRFVAAHFEKSKPPSSLNKKTTTSSLLSPLSKKVLQIYRIFHATANREFLSHPLNPLNPLNPLDHLDQESQRRFFYLELPEQLKTILQGQVSSNSTVKSFSSSSSFFNENRVFLFSDPNYACELYMNRFQEANQKKEKGTKKQVYDDKNDEDIDHIDNECIYQQLLFCRIHLNRCMASIFGERPKTLLELETLQLPQNCHFLQFNYTKDDENHSILILETKDGINQVNHHTYFLPQYLVLCAVQYDEVKEKQLNDLLNRLSLTTSTSKHDKIGPVSPIHCTTQLLNSYIEQVHQQIHHYDQLIYQSLDPVTAANLEELDERRKESHSVVQNLRSAIEGEKNLQEKLICEYRGQTNRAKNSRYSSI